MREVGSLFLAVALVAYYALLAAIDLVFLGCVIYVVVQIVRT